MNATGQPSFEFALDSLRLCLERPLVYGDREWSRRMTRAIDRMRRAFADHVDRLEAAGGPFDRIADPNLLPIFPGCRKIRRLRREHRRLRARIELLAAQFRSASDLYPPRGDTAGTPSKPAAQEGVHAFRLLGTLSLCVKDLLDALQAHRATEDRLLRRTGGHVARIP